MNFEIVKKALENNNMTVYTAETGKEVVFD